MHKMLARMTTVAPDSLVAQSRLRGKSPWTDAVHLLWTVWVFLMPVFDRFTWLWFWLTVASYPLFLLLYAGCCMAAHRHIAWFAAGMIAMAYALLPWYGSALVYFTFGCIMLSSCRMSLRLFLAVVAALNAALVAVAHYLLHYPWVSLISIPVLCLVVGVVVRAERASEEQRAQLRLSHEEIRRLAATAERERIGRDLHDLLGHTLSLITLKLELSRKLFERDAEAARREVAEAERVARHALAEVRAAVTGIRATDLAAELASARLLLESSGVRLDYGLPPDGLPPEVERPLALVLREAATNVARHARARSARVAWSVEGGQLCLLVGDDGRGGIGPEGNGLAGMRERVRALHGYLEIDSPRGQGTRVTVRVPCRLAKLAAPAALLPEGAPALTPEDAA